jgi:AAA+ superfamily predicted ATPase
VNYWLRGYSSESVNKDYVLGGNLDSITDNDGVYRVVMKLQVKVQKLSDFGVYKCVAKNALGNAEEIVRILRKYKQPIKKLETKLTILNII